MFNFADQHGHGLHQLLKPGPLTGGIHLLNQTLMFWGEKQVTWFGCMYIAIGVIDVIRNVIMRFSKSQPKPSGAACIPLWLIDTTFTAIKSYSNASLWSITFIARETSRQSKTLKDCYLDILDVHLKTYAQICNHIYMCLDSLHIVIGPVTSYQIVFQWLHKAPCIFSPQQYLDFHHRCECVPYYQNNTLGMPIKFFPSVLNTTVYRDSTCYNANMACKAACMRHCKWFIYYRTKSD